VGAIPFLGIHKWDLRCSVEVSPETMLMGILATKVQDCYQRVSKRKRIIREGSDKITGSGEDCGQ
jgi:hypothetical protein